MIAESSTFHTAIFDALCACLGLANTSAQAIKLIHEAYADPENVPQPGRKKNVIYWYVMQESGSAIPAAYSAEGASASGSQIPTVYTTLKYQLIVVCYGPLCEAYASRIRNMIFLDGKGFPRQILRNKGIYPIPDPPQPSVLYEEEGSLWRKRADLTISLRVRDEQQGTARQSITTAPAVVIRRNE